ncbi:MAG: aspartyl-tRNA(Asn)/glutamyl-tRNA(Gln) amidotransferase subunit A [Granulosicoccus sp.]|jgi:aspartyl-tRNA(Asn)/glutamyl-tRNA(Gln) amidotransferase subunit A
MSDSKKQGDATVDLFENGIAHWGRRVRVGELTFLKTIEICLSNIEQNSELNAFECLNTAAALEEGVLMDQQLANGIDLGPLMGAPVGIKDIMYVDGMPTKFGSNADLSDLLQSEGSVVAKLKSAGAIILGKTKTVEFALGATGINQSRGTPWNPVDRSTHRMPGGSSSGSAVATSAGLVAFAIGTDTGGSIRNPACMTGIVGQKTSVGLWPLDGVFSLSSTLDSVGPLCRTVSDTALVHQAMTDEPVTVRDGLQGLRLGIVEDLFFDDLDEKVAKDFERVCLLLESHGAIRVPLRFPELHERTVLFSSIVPPELISYLGAERYLAIRGSVDTVTESRASVGLDVCAHQYLTAQKRRQLLISKAYATFSDVDVWLSPTSPTVPLAIAEFSDPEIHAKGLLASRNAQPGNLLDMCALSLPMHQNGLPTGLQISMPLKQDADLLGVSSVIESLFRAHIAPTSALNRGNRQKSA